MVLADSDHMQRAIERAREAVGITSPNPPVGAVLVKNGEVIGEGHIDNTVALHQTQLKDGRWVSTVLAEIYTGPQEYY